MEEYKIFDSIYAIRPDDLNTSQDIDKWLEKKLEEISKEGRWQLVGTCNDKFFFKRSKSSTSTKKYLTYH